MGDSGLKALELQVARDLQRIAYPKSDWVPPRYYTSGGRVLDALIVGGGQGWLAIGHGLLRNRVTNIRIVDRA